jgi:hypothetical protein
MMMDQVRQSNEMVAAAIAALGQPKGCNSNDAVAAAIVALAQPKTSVMMVKKNTDGTFLAEKQEVSSGDVDASRLGD